ncbi:hypothetical protein GGS23DRAFT_84420 [Durotheca rogersii]|uniref:uncharacterized protein n=1 Tax=Durotheca rogersii TaxID=419775 RepID=UPI00221FE93C|nr:uncharacterized protein GGS23DRAFT_84420 [Durotheca rogersii]KAI5862611.1 hypothetical protein GGS23DRAFT_84420 [Durotheca rogersii]
MLIHRLHGLSAPQLRPLLRALSLSLSGKSLCLVSVSVSCQLGRGANPDRPGFPVGQSQDCAPPGPTRRRGGGRWAWMAPSGLAKAEEIYAKPHKRTRPGILLSNSALRFLWPPNPTHCYPCMYIVIRSRSSASRYKKRARRSLSPPCFSPRSLVCATDGRTCTYYVE